MYSRYTKDFNFVKGLEDTRCICYLDVVGNKQSKNYERVGIFDYIKDTMLKDVMNMAMFNTF